MTPMPLCLKLRKSFKTSMRTLLSHKCSTLMCVTTCPLHNVPLPHQKAKAVTRQRRIARNLKRNFNKCLYMLCRQRGIPTADGPTSRPSPTSTRLPVPSNGPTDQHGIPMAGLHAPGLHCIQCKLVVAFITSYYICNLGFKSGK